MSQEMLRGAGEALAPRGEGNAMIQLMGEQAKDASPAYGGGGALRRLNLGRAARVLSAALLALLCATGVQAIDRNVALATEDFASETIQAAGVSTYAPARPQKQGWVIEGSSVYYYENGRPAAGWKEYLNPSNGAIESCYFGDDGAAVSGWQTIGGKRYYFGTSGYHHAYVLTHGARTNVEAPDSNGVWHETAWRQDSNGWWFDFGNGTYAQNSWQPIGDEWYHFDSSGYMQVGWLYLGGTWYYLAESGAMQVGWLHNGGAWYYLNDGGDMHTGWKSLGGTWYYLNGSGVMQTGWLRSGGTWYYLNSGGDMATGWRKVGGVWYFLNSSGDMATGWKKIGNAWYYLNGGGDMAENRWIGNYWVGADGAMATNAWVDGGKYYVGSDGVYDPQARRQEAAA